jgi:hypothetical protein
MIWLESNHGTPWLLVSHHNHYTTNWYYNHTNNLKNCSCYYMFDVLNESIHSPCLALLINKTSCNFSPFVYSFFFFFFWKQNYSWHMTVTAHRYLFRVWKIFRAFFFFFLIVIGPVIELLLTMINFSNVAHCESPPYR